MTGFTLMELVLVLTIAAVLTLVATPRMLDTGAFQKRLDLEDTLAALHHSRGLAMASGCRTRLGVSSGQLVLHRAADCQGVNFTIALPLPGSVPAASDAMPDFIFDHLGRLVDAHGQLRSGTVTLSLAGGTIRVEAATGLARR